MLSSEPPGGRSRAESALQLGRGTGCRVYWVYESTSRLDERLKTCYASTLSQAYVYWTCGANSHTLMCETHVRQNSTTSYVWLPRSHLRSCLSFYEVFSVSFSPVAFTPYKSLRAQHSCTHGCVCNVCGVHVPYKQATKQATKLQELKRSVGSLNRNC